MPAASTSAGYGNLLFTCGQGVATLVLNRPHRRNALDQVLRDELAEAVTRVRRDRDIKVLVLKGAGGAFCAGGDIESMQRQADAEQARDRMVALHGVIHDLLTLDRPVIAAVDGAAYGAGLGLALTADLILASPRAQFCLSFLRLGAVPDSGVFYTLPRIVGVQRAKALAFSTRPFGAEEARDLGIVMEIVPTERLDDRADRMARALAGLPTAVLGMTKRAFDASLDSGLPAMLEMEAAAQGVARSTAYHQEAVRRFLDKQPPAFQWPAAE
nr:enoyl-CoA hydratase/isomerase family protein [Bordetella genomosp. 13]